MALTQEQLNRILGNQSVVDRVLSTNAIEQKLNAPENIVTGGILPIQKNKVTGQMALAMPEFIKSIQQAYTAPARAMRGEFDPNSIQGIQEANNIGLNLLGIGQTAPIVSRGATAGMQGGKTLSMFVGEAGINRLDLQDVLAKANEMKKAKVPDEEIWKATYPLVAEKGVRGGGITYQFGGVPHLEISDDLAKVNPMAKGDFNFAPLSQILEHPTLYKAQPSLKAIAVSPQEIDYSFYNRNEGLLGVGTPHRTTTGYNDNFGNRIEQYNFKPDVIGHEVNHAIQFDQNLPQGGNKSTKKLLNKFFEAEKKNYDPALSRIANEQQNLSNLYKDSAILDFNRILNKPSYKPSDLYRRGDFYQYSDEIRSKLGSMPKKAGESRNEYIRNANQIIFDKYKEKKGITQQDVDKALGKTSAQTKYQINKIYKKLEPDYAANRELAKLKDKNYQINELTPYQVYDRLTGEATSRLVQDRWDMTPEQRGLLYPVPKLMDTNQKINPYELIDLYYN
jgi:hypothetical protein